MAKTEKMTDEELISLIDQHVTDALGYDDAISTQREKAMEYYYGLPFGNEVEGRSQFVDSTVQDTIEWIMPSLMRVFASGDEDGRKLAKRDPTYVLRERLLRIGCSDKDAMTSVDQCAALFKAFRAFAHNVEIGPRQLAWRRYGPAAEKFPEI